MAEVDQPERLPEYLSRAFHAAQSGRPGPVALALPEDVLSADVPMPATRPAKDRGASAAGSGDDAAGVDKTLVF